MFSCSLIFLGFIGCGLASTLAPILMQSGCVQNGKTYKIGESFQPTPCEHCFCSPDGRVVCAVADCIAPPCVDSVHDPTKCCPTCPNGANCRHKDGTIINKDDTYKPDNHTTCICASGFNFGSTQAMCLVEPVNPVIIDPPHVD